MFEFDDPWWLVAVILMLGMWAVEIMIPVKITVPAFEYARQMVAQNERASQSEVESEPPPRPPTLGILWPALAVALSALLTLLSIWRRFVDDEHAARWNWMTVASGATLLAAMVLLQLTASVAHKLAGLG